jgi:hypothetical protein
MAVVELPSSRSGDSIGLNLEAYVSERKEKLT